LDILISSTASWSITKVEGKLVLILGSPLGAKKGTKKNRMLLNRTSSGYIMPLK
jgi:hypothetical protein